MAIVHPSLNMIGKNKKKLNVKQQRALAEHEEWLRKQGLHKEQIAKKPKTKSVITPILNTSNGLQLSNKIVSGGFKKSIWDSKWRNTYEDNPQMAEREDEALLRADKLKGRLMPLYNKGPVQFCTDLSTLKEGNGRGKN